MGILCVHVAGIMGKETTHVCKFYIVLTPEQQAQLATPYINYRKKSPRPRNWSLLPLQVKTPIHRHCYWGSQQLGHLTLSTTAVPPEKKAKKEKSTTSKSTKTVDSKSATDGKTEELDQKWSDRFNYLEALLMASWPRLFNQLSHHLSR